MSIFVDTFISNIGRVDERHIKDFALWKYDHQHQDHKRRGEYLREIIERVFIVVAIKSGYLEEIEIGYNRRENVVATRG